MADIENDTPAQTDSAATSDLDASRESEDVLALARERFRLASEADTEIRRLALEDLRFRAGDQWPEALKKSRDEDDKPCLTVNRLPALCHQVTNDQRQNRPAIKVHPLDSQATKETADVIQGLIRHIEYNSNAESAYDTASDAQVSTGRGYFRITTGYADPESFDQEIYIRRILDPMTVFFDPNSQEADGSDARFAFIIEDMSREEYKAAYPQSKLSAPGAEWEAFGLHAPAWFHNGAARIAEYFSIEEEEETIHLLGTGLTVRASDLEHAQAAAFAAKLDGSVKKSRTTRVPYVKWRKINAFEVLEETTFPGRYIPIVPVYGAELVVNGKRIFEGLIRHAKDAQRMYNYWKSAETETIALAPRAPYIAAEGQIEPHRRLWATANKKNHAYLPYKPTAIGGTPCPPPQRQQYEPATQAITQAAMGASEDIKGTTGVYDGGVGAQSNETAGVAIKARAGQVQTANFHFSDNSKRSQKHAGRIIVDLIPYIYDTARAARIIGADDTQKVVLLNQPHQDESGKDVLYDVTTGRYDVTIDSGPSFASKREEAAEGTLEMARAVPEIMKVAGDLIVKNMDWPGAAELAERLKKTLPPGLADDSKQGQVPPQVQAQLIQQGQMIQALTQHLHEKTQLIEQKAIERDMLQMELEAKKDMEALRLRTDAEIALAKIDSADGIALLKHQVGELMQREKLASQLQSQALGAQADAMNDPDDQSGAAPGGSPNNFGPRGPNPTGGISPGTSMEGTS